MAESRGCSGGTLGINIEYFSIIYGIKALAWFAMAIYALVLVLEQFPNKERKIIRT